MSHSSITHGSLQLKEIFVLAYDYTIIGFSVVPNFLVCGSVEGPMGNMERFQALLRGSIRSEHLLYL